MPTPISDLQRRLLCEGWIDPENEGAAGSVFLPVLRYCRQDKKVWIAEGDEHIVESATLQEAQQNDGIEIVESIDELDLEERVLPNGAKTKLPKGGIWIVEGPAQRSDVKNANKRTYGRSIWERLIADDASPVQKAIKARGMIGHLEHPKDGRTDGKEGALVVTESRLRDDGVVWNKFELLDTPNGLILQEYTKKNVRWGVSSRGTGKVDETGKVIDESYMLETWDAVMRPSTPGAFPRMAEGEEGLEGLDLDEETLARLEEVVGLSTGDVQALKKFIQKSMIGTIQALIFHTDPKNDALIDALSRALKVARKGATEDFDPIVTGEEDDEDLDEVSRPKPRKNIVNSFLKVLTNFDDAPLSVRLASFAEALDHEMSGMDPGEFGVFGPVERLTGEILRAAMSLAKVDEGEEVDDPAAPVLEAYDALVEKIDTVSIEEADHSLIGNMLDVFGKTVDLAAKGNLAAEKANEMSGWLTQKITDIMDAGGGGLEESIDRALAALDDIDEDDADDDPRDKIIETLRSQLMVVSTEADSLRETLEGTNSEVAAANESRDDALERLTEAEETARDTKRKLDLANDLLAQRSADSVNGDAIEAVDEAIKGVPGLARFRKVLLRATSRDEVKELAEVLLPVIAKPKPQVLPAVPRSALPVGIVESEEVKPPKGGAAKEPSPGAQAAAQAVKAQKQRGL